MTKKDSHEELVYHVDPESFGVGMESLFERSWSESKQELARSLNPAETAGFMALATQCVSNGFLRQSASNLKLAADLESANGWAIVDMVKKNPRAIFTNGMLARLGYQATGILPALMVRQKLTESGAGNFQISFGVAATETLMRAPFEMSTIKTAIAQRQGVEVGGKQAAHLWHRSFYPFFFRNYLAWAVINHSSDNLFEKTAFGVMSGVTSTPLETLGNLVIKHSVTADSMKDAYEKAFEDLQKGERSAYRNAVSNSLRGVGVRAFAGAFSAVLLSSDLGKLLTQNFTPMAREFRDYCCGKAEDLEPGASVTKPQAHKKDDSVKTK